MRKERRIKFLKIVLVLASVLAAVKVLLVDYTLDEEYQIVMAYRSLSGDALFRTMWEPHQTSAFACIGLMWIFEKFTGGTTGVVLFLRLVTTGIQLLFSLWVTKALRRVIGREYAFLIGCCYFNMIPKIIQIPEFSNLQLWFFTAMVLLLMRYLGTGPSEKNGSKALLAAAGVAMALEVLAYPSCVILFPFFLFVIGRRAGWKDALIFAAVCGGCAAVWLCMILSKLPPEEFLRNVNYILTFDQTHGVSLTGEYGTGGFLRGLGAVLIPLAASGALAFLAWRLHRGLNFAVFLVFAAEAVQIFYWVVLQRGYEEPQLYLLMLFVLAASVWKQTDARRKILAPGICGGVITILAVIYMSDMDAWYAIPHGLLGALFAAAVFSLYAEERWQEKGRNMSLLLLFSLAFCIVFGKGFTLRAGNTDTNSVLGIRGMIRKGPAAGIFTNYMQAYIMNCTYEDFEKYVEEGENCLIVTNMVGTAGTSPYLFRNNRVSHFSVVDPTSYDERLLTYWKLYPDKYPEVIVVDCWYGQLMEQEDSWIMQYIETEFGYTSVEDGRYVRFYRRERQEETE